jgi:hypothetical protein
MIRTVAFFWLAFLGEARKVTCRRAAPAYKYLREAHTPTAADQSVT